MRSLFAILILLLLVAGALMLWPAETPPRLADVALVDCVTQSALFVTRAQRTSDTESTSPDGQECQSEFCKCAIATDPERVKFEHQVVVRCLTPQQLRCRCADDAPCLDPERGYLLTPLAVCNRLGIEPGVYQLSQVDELLNRVELNALEDILSRCTLRRQLQYLQDTGCPAVQSDFNARTVARDCLAAEYDRLCGEAQASWDAEGEECERLYAREGEEDALSLTAACLGAICVGEPNEGQKVEECIEQVCQPIEPTRHTGSCEEQRVRYKELAGACIGTPGTNTKSAP